MSSETHFEYRGGAREPWEKKKSRKGRVITHSYQNLPPLTGTASTTFLLSQILRIHHVLIVYTGSTKLSHAIILKYRGF